MNKELKRTIKKEHQERWLKLMLLLCKLEERYGTRLNNFTFNKNEISFRDDDDKLVSFGI